jgi:hypothetical protein
MSDGRSEAEHFEALEKGLVPYVSGEGKNKTLNFLSPLQPTIAPPDGNCFYSSLAVRIHSYCLQHF